MKSFSITKRVNMQAVITGSSGFEVLADTEPAALELTVKRGKLKHVVICGHSDCKVSSA